MKAVCDINNIKESEVYPSNYCSCANEHTER